MKSECALSPHQNRLDLTTHARDSIYGINFEQLDKQGYCVVQKLLDPTECRVLSAFYEGNNFRSAVTMEKHGFGQGEYRYFGSGLPSRLSQLRGEFYRILACHANRRETDCAFPKEYEDFAKINKQHHQTENAIIAFRYHDGDYNRLHQDKYGEIRFPYQILFLLSEPGEDFTGGEFVLTEQEYRKQTKVKVVPLHRGDMLIFANEYRYEQNGNRRKQIAIKHGVSEVLSGQRDVLAIIFHNAPLPQGRKYVKVTEAGNDQ